MLRPAILACLCLLVSPLYAQAALPPNYQRLAELRAILESKAVLSRFAQASIDRVEYVSPDLYRVTAGACSLEVTILDSAPIPGPGNFNVVPGSHNFKIVPGAYACH